MPARPVTTLPLPGKETGTQRVKKTGNSLEKLKKKTHAMLQTTDQDLESMLKVC